MTIASSGNKIASSDRVAEWSSICILEPMNPRPSTQRISMIVPYADLKAQYAALREEVLAALDRVGSKAAFILGEEVQEFEREFAAYCGVKHCVAVNSGTSALHLALLGWACRAGDEVITTPNTFIATAEAISYTGAKAGVRGYRPAHGQHRSRQNRGGHNPTHAGHSSRAPLRAGGGDGSDPGDRRAAQTGRHRGRLPGARGALPRQAGGRHRQRCGVQLLSHKKPGRLWRRRRPHDQ